MCDGIQRQGFGQDRTHVGEREEAIRLVAPVLAQWHDLDEGDVHAGLVRPGHECGELVVVKAFECDGVDLHRQPGIPGRRDSLEYNGKVATARDRPEAVGIEGVERDVHPPDPAIGKLGRETGELRPVCGQGQLLELARLQVTRQATQEIDNATPHERLAPGDAQLAGAPGHENRTKPVQFFDGQELATRQELHGVRHAVGAAEVAAVRHRDAEIGDRPPERVDQRLLRRDGQRLGQSLQHSR